MHYLPFVPKWPQNTSFISEQQSDSTNAYSFKPWLTMHANSNVLLTGNNKSLMTSKYRIQEAHLPTFS